MTKRRAMPPARFEPTDATLIKRQLWVAQLGHCPYCPRRLPHIGWDEDSGRLQNTIEHVWPKHLRNGRQGANALGFGLLDAHSECNWIKANRAPFPCELIFLDAVNTRLAAKGKKFVVIEAPGRGGRRRRPL